MKCPDHGLLCCVPAGDFFLKLEISPLLLSCVIFNLKILISQNLDHSKEQIPVISLLTALKLFSRFFKLLTNNLKANCENIHTKSIIFMMH